MRILFSFFIVNLFIVECNSQAPLEQWAKSLGGTGSDFSYSIHQTSDDGYIVAGNNDYSGFWIVKLDNAGDTLWSKNMTGTCDAGDHTILETADGGILLGGEFNSNIKIQKLTSTGNIVWSKNYGGSGSEYIHSIQETSDKGFILAGSSNSVDGDVTGNHGSFDFWVVKADSAGNIQWQKSYGGSGIDNAFSVNECYDLGFVIAGSTLSNNGDVTGNHGYSDYWIVKTDVNGTIQWQKNYGGTGDEELYSLCLTTDSGYVVAGGSESADGDVSGHHSSSDFWILKLNESGDTVWTRSYGGSGFDEAKSIKSTTDGGFIVAGRASSFDGDVHGVIGGGGFWLVRLSSAGDTLWTKVIGGNDLDGAESVQQTADGGYVVAGWTSSFPISGMYYDYRIVKLFPESTYVENTNYCSEISIYPNPTNGIVNVKADHLNSIEVLNMNGKLLRKSAGTKSIDMKNLPEGNYLIRIMTDRVSYTEAIHKE